jgi:hypothetical protein
MSHTSAKREWSAFVLVLFACCVLLQPTSLPAESVAVRYREGLTHGFLVLRTLEGKTLAEGDLTQVTRGNRVTARVLFHFKDGSVHDETTVFSQGKTFRLLSEHLIQQGPSFEHPIDVLIDGSTGNVTVRTTDHDGKEKVESERIDLPQDVANGLIFTLLKNLGAETTGTKLAMVATTPQPRMVKLAITRQGTEPFSIGDSSRKVTHYVVKVEIGGAAGLVAPLLGKQPPDIHVWILGGDAPVFIKSEGPLFYGGPVWRIELVSPSCR